MIIIRHFICEDDHGCHKNKEKLTDVRYGQDTWTERRSAMRESGANCHDKYAGKEGEGMEAEERKLLPLLGPCHFCLLASFRASHRIEELQLREGELHAINDKLQWCTHMTCSRRVGEERKSQKIITRLLSLTPSSTFTQKSRSTLEFVLRLVLFVFRLPVFTNNTNSRSGFG